MIKIELNKQNSIIFYTKLHINFWLCIKKYDSLKLATWAYFCKYVRNTNKNKLPSLPKCKSSKKWA